MSHIRSLLSLALCLSFFAFPVRAEDSPFVQPDLVSFGGGFVNFDTVKPGWRAGDFRLEYRWGVSLLSTLLPFVRPVDSVLQLHPLVGIEFTTQGAFYGAGGLALDAFLGKRIVVTWSEAAGYFNKGDGPSIGSAVEFRSMGEIGYVFDNQTRLSFFVNHKSNDRLTRLNPGESVVGFYVHVPMDILLGE